MIDEEKVRPGQVGFSALCFLQCFVIVGWVTAGPGPLVPKLSLWIKWMEKSGGPANPCLSGKWPLEWR